MPALAEMGETVQIGGDAAYGLLGMEALNEMDENTLYMHLHRAVGLVYGVKEAMWDELMVRVHRHDETLKKYGWKADDYNEQASRTRFDFAIAQYKRCVSRVTERVLIVVPCS